MEAPLRAERASLEERRRAYAVEAVQAFEQRYDACVAQLQQLWAEGKILAETLRTEVPMPLPTKVTTSPIDGIARSVPVLTGGPVTVTVDVEAAKLAAQLDRLDGAISLCNAIRQDREFTSRHHHLSLQRGGAPTEQVGSVYRVIAPFPCLTDGLPFAAGRWSTAAWLAAAWRTG